MFQPRFSGRAYLVLAKSVTGHALPLLEHARIQEGVGILGGMVFARQAEHWKKTMQFDCLNPVNSHLGHP
jgi:hypothetical protein